ncbi:unnamed protein product [Caenorhabditis angaria]|uniref:Uncharacterized protein n=1 Tax=Caenorhabditis angaria TaxID=860376 RepID=A0A9P1IEQ7_9PELO|nr:unnamed protein product [Caenorhabditis angaria]
MNSEENELELEDFSDSDLLLESMIEIEENQAKSGGFDSDPFDRTDEYDTNLDLNAPIAPTPDILQFLDEKQQPGEIDVQKLRENTDLYAAILEIFPVKMFANWKDLIKAKNPHFMPKIEEYLESKSISEPSTSQNSLESPEFLELDLFAAEMRPGIYQPIFSNENFDDFSKIPEDLDVSARIFGVLIETRIFMRDLEEARRILTIFEEKMKGKGISRDQMQKSLLPIEQFWNLN